MSCSDIQIIKFYNKWKCFYSFIYSILYLLLFFPPTCCGTPGTPVAPTLKTSALKDFSTCSAFIFRQYTYLVVKSVYHPEQQTLLGPDLRCGQHVVHIMARLLPPGDKARPKQTITYKPCMRTTAASQQAGPKTLPVLTHTCGANQEERLVSWHRDDAREVACVYNGFRADFVFPPIVPTANLSCVIRSAGLSSSEVVSSFMRSRASRLGLW